MCATGLRHAPTFRRGLWQISAGPSRTEARAQHPEPVADASERLRVGRLFHAELELLRAARLGDEPLLGPLQRQALFVEQRLDPLDQLEIAGAIQTLSGRILLRAEELELRLPVTQHVRGDSRDGLDLPDAVV